MSRLIRFNPLKPCIIFAKKVLLAFLAGTCLVMVSLPAGAALPPIIHLSDPGEWLISQHGPGSLASVAGAGDKALLVITGGALRSSGAPDGREEAYAVALLDAAGVAVANLAHRDMVGNADSFNKAVGAGKVQFVSASFRLAGQPWQPYTIIRVGDRNVGFIGVAGFSPSMALSDRGAIPGLEYVPPSEAVRFALQQMKGADSIVLLADLPLSEALKLRAEFTSLSAILNSGRGGIQFVNAEYAGIHLSPPGGFRVAVLEERKKSRVTGLFTPKRINPLHTEAQKRFDFAVAPLGARPDEAFQSVSPPAESRPGDTVALNLTRENRAVRWTIHSAARLDTLGPAEAPEGRNWMVFDVEWENLLTPRVVREQELPVTYSVRELSDHLYLVEEGKRLLPMETIKGIPNLIEGKNPVRLPHLGSTHRGLLVYSIAVDAKPKQLEFRYYDFAHGHMTVSVPGTDESKADMVSAEPALMESSNEIVTAGLFGIRKIGEIGGRVAPENMTFIEVDLRARSMFTFEADAGAFVPLARPGETIEVGTVSDWLEAHKYTHLLVDSEYAYTPDTELTTVPSNPRFLPDVMTGGNMVFMVPEPYESLVLRADFPNARLPGGDVIRPEPIRLNLKGEPDRPPERDAIWQVTDDTIRVAITGLQRTDDFAGTMATPGKHFLVIDVTVSNHGGKPEFFQTAEQLRHVDAHGLEAPPHPVSYEGRYRPVEHVWVPEGEQRAFQLAYLVDRGDTHLNLSYRGFTLAMNVELHVDSVTGPVAIAKPLEIDPVQALRIDSPTQESLDLIAEAPIPALSKERAWERLALHPLTIADTDFNAPFVVMLEPPEHGSMENALLLGEPWTARGILERNQRHYFRLAIDGEPQLWYFESTGAGLEYRDPSGSTQLQRRLDSATQKAAMTGLLLLPGDHWFSVHTLTAGDYTFRAVPLGPPDPHSEIEPNDDLASAQRMDFGFHRTGRLYEPGDRDRYRFSTMTTENVAIILEAPGDMTLCMELMEVYGGSTTRNIHGINGGDIEYRTRLPAGDYLINIFGRPSNQRSDHPYVLRLVRLDPFDPEFIEATDDLQSRDTSDNTALPVSLSLGEMTAPLAAFWSDAQRVRLPLQIVNRGSLPLALQLDAHASHPDILVSFSDPNLTVFPGGHASTAVILNMPPDLHAGLPIAITVRACGVDGAQLTTHTTLIPECAVAPQDPIEYWPLPEALLGGLNVAWTSLGAEVDDQDHEKNQVLKIFDGYTPFNDGYSRPPRFPREFTVKLAGDAPMPIAGIALHPLAAKGNPDHRVKSFDVLVSLDGQSFQQVLSGELDRRAQEQVFVFDAPVMARYARLRINSNHIGTTGRTMLGQWKVIAQPGIHIPGKSALNIASGDIGAHVVWSDPFPKLSSQLQNMLIEGGRTDGFNLREPRPIRWVVGFPHQRVARITELQWVDGPAGNRFSPLSEVLVSVSTESPLGPWTELGTWKLDRTSAGVAPFVLSDPLWARYVLFTSYDPDKPRTSWQMPETLRIMEQLPDEHYRSIAAEWGHYNRKAVYERLEQPDPEPFISPVKAYATRADPRPLPAGTAHSGAVQVGESEDWYRIEMPQDADRLTLSMLGRPNLRVQVQMKDTAGEPVALQRDDISPRERVMRAEVRSGAAYYLRVYEPPRSIIFAWDNSGSMGPYKAALHQGLRQFVEKVTPGLEYANFLPFQSNNPKLLHPEWSDQSHQLWVTLTNYHRRDDSSNSEPNLLAATRALADRDGARAILLLTDAETFGFADSGELWEAMAKTPPQIFSVELHTGRSQPYQQNLMQSWASVNAGHYNLFSSQQDIDVSFSRASCMLRRPAQYTLTALMEKEEPSEEEVETDTAERHQTDMLETLTQEGRVIAHGILFDINSHALRSQSYTVLRQIGSMLRTHPDLRILIEGHTDSSGRTSLNQVLSERRADSVRRFLIDNYNIDPGRLDSIGYGQDRPTDTNDTAQGRQNNRRVELVRIAP